jgi:hypothetical protein
MTMLSNLENEFDKRALERTPCNRGALLRILNDIFSFTIRDASERGIGIRLHSRLPLIPVEFLISEDGFKTARRCRLVWREGDFAGAEFADRLG